MEDLDSILNGEPANEPDVTTEPVAQEEPAQSDRPRDEHGRFVPKETGVEEQVQPAEPVPPTEQPQQLPPAEYAALRDERRKRQELERQLQQLQAQAPPQPQAPAPDFWENPDAALEQRFQQFGQTLMQQFQAQQWSERATAQETAARAKYADFDDKLETFHQLAATNPAIVQELRSAPDVAEFAYRKASEAMALQQHGGLEGYEKALRAKWEAELKAGIPALNPPPATTATERSVGARGGPTWAGPQPLTDILGH